MNLSDIPLITPRVRNLFSNSGDLTEKGKLELENHLLKQKAERMGLLLKYIVFPIIVVIAGFVLTRGLF